MIPHSNFNFMSLNQYLSQKNLKVDNLRLNHFEQIINTKSKNSIKVDEHIILNPHPLTSA